MSKKANPAAIGLFVLAAAAICIAAILVLGSGKLFSRHIPCIMYFEKSVAGLDVGAPVELRGVRIGTVTEIAMTFDREKDDILIPVHVRIEPDRIRMSRQERVEFTGEATPDLVKRGLRAQLQAQSFVTGKLKIVLDFFPYATPAEAVWNGEAWEVPTVGGPLDQIAAKVKDLPIQEMVFNADQTLKNLNTLLSSAELAASISNLNKTLVGAAEIATRLEAAHLDQAAADLQTLVADLRAGIDKGSIKELLANINQTLAESQAVMSSVRNNTTPMRDEVVETLQELTESARAFRILVESIERNPEAFIKGKP